MTVQEDTIDPRAVAKLFVIRLQGEALRHIKPFSLEQRKSIRNAVCNDPDVHICLAEVFKKAVLSIGKEIIGQKQTPLTHDISKSIAGVSLNTAGGKRISEMKFGSNFTYFISDQIGNQLHHDRDKLEATIASALNKAISSHRPS